MGLHLDFGEEVMPVPKRRNRRRYRLRIVLTLSWEPP